MNTDARTANLAAVENILRERANVVLRCTDDEATWTTTLGEFLAANDCDEEVCDAVSALGPGASADLGGYVHCGGVFVVERVS